MTEAMIALAKRAVACKGWRWMTGMLRGDGFRCTWVDEDERELAAPTWCANGIEWKNGRTGSKDLPDLTDPATLGCLLALVREAWNDAKVHVLYVDGLYRWECADRHNVHGSKMTEAEALIAALEAAP